ncbi:MAG: DUF2029 domain-containing protein [Mediterranea sp.]|jgi:hypothetical protein|nr:DUF2029 domain-containing protein [Mediterranea sp.]
MNKIKLAVTIIGGGMFLFLLYSFVVHHYWGLGYPYDTFLCSQIDSFMDFYNVNDFVATLHPYAPDMDVSYPPFALILAYPFSWFFDYSKHVSLAVRDHILPILSYLLLFGYFSYFLLRQIHGAIKGNGRRTDWVYTLILFFTYPVFFLFDRGNYIMLTFIFLFLFAHYESIHSRKSLWFLAMAIAMKIYPILFVFFFLVKKRYKDVCRIALITAGLSLAPMLAFKGNFFSNIEKFLTCLFSFSKGHVNEIQNMSWNSSLSGLIKIPAMLSNNGAVPYDVKVPYVVLVLVLLLVVLFLLKKEERLDRQIMWLTSLSILVMPVSYDYNLIYLYIPFLMLLKARDSWDKDDWFSFLVICLLLIPKSYGILFHDWIWNVSIQSFINPLLLLLLILHSFYKRVCGYAKTSTTKPQANGIETNMGCSER